MIKLENLTKYYKYRNSIYYVFSDLNFEFPTHLSIGILGKNGAGKSTLLRLIGGMENPNKGKVDCGNYSISWPVGRVSGIQGSLSGRDGARFVCQIYGKTPKETKKIIDYVYDFAEIGKYFNMPVKTYSSGMRARVNFGISMAFDFDYYLVDECTSVGDGQFREKARRTFEEKKKKSSIIMVTHNMKEIRDSCDVALYIEDGEVKLYDNVGEAIKLYETSGKK